MKIAKPTQSVFVLISVIIWTGTLIVLSGCTVQSQSSDERTDAESNEIVATKPVGDDSMSMMPIPSNYYRAYQ